MENLQLDIHPVTNDFNRESFQEFDPNRPRNQHNNPWTPVVDAEIIRLWKNGTSVPGICNHLSTMIGYTPHRTSLEKRAHTLGMRRRHPTNWNAVADDILRTLWANSNIQLQDIPGMVNEQCGTKFSRNAIIGRAKRLGCDERNWKPRLYTPQEEAARIEKARQARLRYADKQRTGNPVGRPKLPERMHPFRARASREHREANAKAWLTPPVVDMEIPQEQRKSIIELGAHHCRWPVGEPRDKDFFYCGASLDPARHTGIPPYCPGHLVRAFKRD